ncbi:hypothetical protein LG299_00260 [Microbacterium lacus]|uniref:DUF7882 family protein n=1 Tax=Microbacterium lacus TaxID=415217 RepID=UPI00385161BD
MGTLEYVTAHHIAEIDDRTLAHLQIVICSKLRRDEKFTLRLAPADGFSGPVTVLWLSSSLPLCFQYSLPTHHEINGAWLRLLADAASSNAGLWIMPEPAVAAPAVQHPTPRELARM